MEIPEVAAEQPAPTAPETPTPAPTAPAESPTVGQILATEPAPELVPVGALISEKTGRKNAESEVKKLRQEIDKLQSSISHGATRQEVSADISGLFEKYAIDDTNKEFLNEFAAAVRAGDRSEIETLKSQLSSLTEGKRLENFEAVFEKHFNDALVRMPEFKGIAKPSVIRALSLDPANKDKTFDQIIEEAYDAAVPGKRTVETTRPGGVKEPEAIDYERAKTDVEYLESILADPAKKAEYNANRRTRGRR